ncbi:MAG: HipA N-terminal domain-containing protein [Alloprevotella sp.]
MKKINRLTVSYHDREVGVISRTNDDRRLAFEYAPHWLAQGFSISPLELPLKAGVFLSKSTLGNFGIFEDSLPDGYGRYLLHKTLLKEGFDDRQLSSLERLSIVGNAGMGALTYMPETLIGKEEEMPDFDQLQKKALEVLREQQDTDAELLLHKSGNSGGCRPKVVFTDDEGHWLVKFRHFYDAKDAGQVQFHAQTFHQIKELC